MWLGEIGGRVKGNKLKKGEMACVGWKETRRRQGSQSRATSLNTIVASLPPPVQTGALAANLSLPVMYRAPLSAHTPSRKLIVFHTTTVAAIHPAYLAAESRTSTNKSTLNLGLPLFACFNLLVRTEIWFSSSMTSLVRSLHFDKFFFNFFTFTRSCRVDSKPNATF